jgi:anti-sigma-K factor RskA
MTGHEEWEELAAGWALEALEPDQHQRFAEHLANCRTCPGIVADIEASMAELAFAPTPVAPPAELKQRLLAAVAAEGGADEQRVAVVTRPDRLESLRRRGERRQAQARTGSSLWLRSSAAAAVVLLAVIAAGVWTRGGSSAPQPRWVSLAASSGGGDVAAVELLGKQAWSISTGLPANDASASQYWLWVVPQSGKPVAIGGFDVEPGHVVSEVGTVSEPLSSVKSFAVSKEPGRGVPKAPTTLVAAGSVS